MKPLEALAASTALQWAPVAVGFVWRLLLLNSGTRPSRHPPLLQRMLASRWPKRVRAVNERVGSWRELLGHPGWVTSHNDVDYDACCPGCGQFVAALDTERYGVVGEAPLGYGGTLTTLSPVHFTACCGWYGRLINGVWVGRSG